MKISARNSLHLQEDIAVGFLDFQNPKTQKKSENQKKIQKSEIRRFSLVKAGTRARTSTSTTSESIGLVLKNMYLVLILLLSDRYLILIFKV